MKNGAKLGTMAVAAMLIGGAAYATVQSWRPVMPEFVIDVRTADNANEAPALMLIYDETGGDPFHEGPLGADRRISQCRTVGSLCVSNAARKELGKTQDQAQSVQVRRFNGKGNPIVGGLRWTGSWHPQKVRIVCDLQISDVTKSCALSEVIS